MENYYEEEGEDSPMILIPWYTSLEGWCEILDKTAKILLGVCFILVGALGVTTGMLLTKPILQGKAPNIVENATSQEVENIQDENYLATYPVGFLTHVGEAHPICPFCGSTDTYQTRTGPVGGYWYYYYHCNSCGRDFAEYTENVPT